MEQAEIEENVKELETRLDRLRSLYEQYFMGIEKIEPNVPRKDVERRFQNRLVAELAANLLDRHLGDSRKTDRLVGLFPG